MHSTDEVMYSLSNYISSLQRLATNFMEVLKSILWWPTGTINGGIVATACSTGLLDTLFIFLAKVDHVLESRSQYSPQDCTLLTKTTCIKILRVVCYFSNNMHQHLCTINTVNLTHWYLSLFNYSTQSPNIAVTIHTVQCYMKRYSTDASPIYYVSFMHFFIATIGLLPLVHHAVLAWANIVVNWHPELALTDGVSTQLYNINIGE